MTDERQAYLDLLSPHKKEQEKITLAIDEHLLKEFEKAKVLIALDKKYAKQVIDEWMKDVNDRR